MTIQLTPNNRLNDMQRALKGRSYLQEIGSVTEVSPAKLRVSLPHIPVEV